MKSLSESILGNIDVKDSILEISGWFNPKHTVKSFNDAMLDMWPTLIRKYKFSQGSRGSLSHDKLIWMSTMYDTATRTQEIFMNCMNTATMHGYTVYMLNGSFECRKSTHLPHGRIRNLLKANNETAEMMFDEIMQYLDSISEK